MMGNKWGFKRIYTHWGGAALAAMIVAVALCVASIFLILYPDFVESNFLYFGLVGFLSVLLLASALWISAFPKNDLNEGELHEMV